jgi:hypothetical protein
VALVLAQGARINPTLAYDSAAVVYHAAPIAEALNDTAAADPKLAKLLDKITVLGPYTVVIGAIVQLGAQIAANHKMVAPMAAMGIMEPEALLQAVSSG